MGSPDKSYRFSLPILTEAKRALCRNRFRWSHIDEDVHQANDVSIRALRERSVFLNAYFDTSVSEQHEAWFESFESPEDFAEAVSTLFAIANDRRELDALDFSYPAVDDLADPFLFELLDSAQVVNHVRDVENQPRVDMLGHRELVHRSAVNGLDTDWW